MSWKSYLSNIAKGMKLINEDKQREVSAAIDDFIMDSYKRKPRLKTYIVDLIPEDITLIGSGTFLYSARAKAKDGEVVEVILRLKDEAQNG